MSASEKDLGLSWNWTDHHCPSLVAPVKSYCDNLITILVSRNTLLRVSSLSRCSSRALISSCFKLGEMDQRLVANQSWCEKHFWQKCFAMDWAKTGEAHLAAFLEQPIWTELSFSTWMEWKKRFYGEQVWIVIRLPTARCAKSRQWNISVEWWIKKSVRHKPVRQQRRRQEQQQQRRQERGQQRQRQQLVRREAFYERL